MKKLVMPSDTHAPTSVIPHSSRPGAGGVGGRGAEVVGGLVVVVLGLGGGGSAAAEVIPTLSTAASAPNTAHAIRLVAESRVDAETAFITGLRSAF
ncbi:hypothetical protein AB0A63_00135 [Lentzea sp. NPDC042327]|uniref:hypothetical protein n=1 Tax=Lentzea sp. NPDC042327 TaxID=3154801 RepID=UPI003411701B